MYSSLVLGFLAATAGLVEAQQAQVVCQVVSGSFCLGDNVGHCQNDVYTDTLTCSNDLSSVPPVGSKTGATCYQTNSTSGDAACAYNGIVYPLNAPSFPIPGSGSSAPVYTNGPAGSTSTVYSTTLATVSSCAATVSNCPYAATATSTPGAVNSSTTGNATWAVNGPQQFLGVASANHLNGVLLGVALLVIALL